MCSVTSSQSAGFAFLINRKLLLCSVTSLQKENVDREFYFVESIHNNRIIKDVGYVLL